MTISPKLLFGVVVLAGASLSACGRQQENGAIEGDPFAARSTAKEDQFGKGFGEAFRADPNSKPRTVLENDVVPVSLTAEPVTID